MQQRVWIGGWVCIRSRCRVLSCNGHTKRLGCKFAPLPMHAIALSLCTLWCSILPFPRAFTCVPSRCTFLLPSWCDAMLRLHVFGTIFHVQWWCGQPQAPPHATKCKWWPSQWDLVGRHGGCVGPVGSGLLQALLGTWRVAKDLLGTKVRGADRKRVQARRSGREAEYVRRRNGWMEERTRMAD